MTLDQLKSLLDVPEKIFGDELLSWFASQERSSVHRDDFTFAGKKTYRFCANLTGNEGMSGFGRSQDELTAAVKACAEAIERAAYVDFLKHDRLLNLQIRQNITDMTIVPNDLPKPIAPSFHNSNGCAVGFSAAAAIDSAKIEAI